jgi:hypothetical protein
MASQLQHQPSMTIKSYSKARLTTPTVQPFYRLLLLSAISLVSASPLISLEVRAQEGFNSGPISVNSLVASFETTNNSYTLLESKIKTILREDASSEDKILAIATFAVAAYLDEQAILSNKFESVPTYRVTHVMQSLLASNRLSENESSHDIYNRLVSNWKKACEPRIAAGRGCDFAFRFDKSSWHKGQPDFFRRLEPRHIAHVTSQSVYSQYRPAIHDMANKALKEGKADVVVSGKSYSLLRAANDTLESLIAKATKVWMRVTLDRYYFIIDHEYIAEQYKTEIRSNLEQLSSLSSGETFTVSLVDQSTSLKVGENKSREVLQNQLLEAYRKLHSKKYFGSEELVIFQRNQVRREIMEHEWDGFSFRLAQAPETYEAFLTELRSQLNSIYLARTRKALMNQVLGSHARSSTFFVAPHEIKNYVAKIDAFKRKAEFALIDLPLQSGIDEEVLKEASTLIVDMFNERKGEDPKRIFSDIETALQNLGINTQAQFVELESRHSKILAPPQSSRELQMHQMMFAEKIAQDMGAPSPEIPDLIYFIDRERSALSFIASIDMQEPQKIILDAFQESSIDKNHIEELITQGRFSDLYKKAILKIINETMYIKINNTDYVYGETRSGIRVGEDQKEIERVLLKSLEVLEKTVPGAGWSRFMEGVYRTPIEPKDLRKKEAPKSSGWFRPKR